MAMLDIAIGAIECKQNSVHSSLLEKIKNKYYLRKNEEKIL